MAELENALKDHIPHTYMSLQWVCLQFVIVVFPDHTHLLIM